MPKKTAKTTHWSLFIDESGNFDSPKEQVLLAAVAVAAPDRDSLPLAPRLKAAIQDAAPLIPWPFHRWLATKPTMHAIWWHLASEDKRQHPNIPTYYKEAAQQAIATWQEHAPGLLKNVCERVQTGRAPSDRQIERLRNRLKNNSDKSYYTLFTYQRSATAAVAHTLADLMNHNSQELKAFSFLAAEAPHALLRADENTPYLDLLTLLLERARDALLQLSGEHVVHIHLATRFAKHPQLPESTKSRRSSDLLLNRSHITEACKQIQPLPTTGPARIRFSVGSISAYDKEVHPGIVMADTAANLFSRKLIYIHSKKKLRGLHILQSDAQKQLRLPLALQPGSPSHACAPGKARSLINDARHSTPDSLETPQFSTRWVQEQTTQWISFFENLGEEVI